MFAAPLARALAARGIHYGWVIVALTLGYTVCSSAALAIPGVLLLPISHEFGWSIGELSGPLGLRVTLFGLIAPFAGGLLLRYGQRAVLTISAGLLTISMLIAFTMTQKWQLWIGFGTLMGIAPGLTALVMTTTVSTRWFAERRGLVTGILSAGNATGQLIFLPPAAWLAEHYGWRAALVPATGLVIVLAALFFLLGRDHPSELGLPAYGARAVVPPPPRSADNAFTISIAGLVTASRSLTFWVLAFTFCICGVSSFGLMPHFVTLCGDNGIPPLTSTGLLALIGVCDFIGTIGSGWLSDRYDNRWLLAGYYGFRGISLLWLPYSGFTMVGLSMFAVFYGLDFIATVPPSVRLTIRAFGAQQAPVVFGWIFAAHQLGAGVMAFAAGETRDAFSTYLPAFFAAGLFCLLATLSLGLLRALRPPAVAPA